MAVVGKNIIILGPPGSGKTTQAELLAKKFALKHISLGAEFRREAEEHTPLGEEARGYLTRGELVPHRLVMTLIDKIVPQNNFVLEGFPRELRQAEELSLRVDLVFYLFLPDDLGISRVLLRQRADDNSLALKRRFALYHKMTEPVLDFYRQQGLLIAVNGEGAVEEISQKIIKLTEKRFS